MQNSETKPITLLFDLETTPLSQEDVELHCLVTLDYETGETTRYNDTGTEEPISRGVTYLMDADTIIGHNIIGFDIPMIKKVYPFFEPKGRIIDTLLLSRLYHPDMLEVDRKAKIDGMPPKLYGRHSLESYGHRLGEIKRGTLDRLPTGQHGARRWRTIVNKALLLQINYANISTLT